MTAVILLCSFPILILGMLGTYAKKKEVFVQDMGFVRVISAIAISFSSIAIIMASWNYLVML